MCRSVRCKATHPGHSARIRQRGPQARCAVLHLFHIVKATYA
jgi:hypothetical protein